jgi:alanine racemase
MDQVMLNVTHLPFDVLAGEEVVLFGHRESGPSVEEIARKAGTIPWEIFTGIGLRVDREWTGGPHDA